MRERNPGWFTPNQIPAIERHFGKPLEELLETELMLDWWRADGDLPHIWIVSPRSRSATGRMAPECPPFGFFWDKGGCSLLVKGKCGIHTLKPRECAIARHDVSDPPGNDTHRAIAAMWNKPALQKRLAKLAEFQPQD